MSENLTSFAAPATVALFGAGGGIGAEFLRQLHDNPNVGQIYAFNRTPLKAVADRVTAAEFDLRDEATIAAAAETVAPQSLDLVIVASGILHDGERLQPEKSMRDLDAATMQEVFAINTVGPALIARHFLPLLRRDRKAVFAALSARVGSIGDNRLGGWASYRMSKAALNMLLRTLAIEQTRRAADSVVVGLHPGTVASGLSAPFTSRVPEERLFTPRRAAAQLINVIDGLTAADTGYVFAWDGSRIEF
ncbi:MAG: SDR family NAD(P)-dependent oxidoreductase [Gammaproteobacteria bacterium]|nr:SDR family NAD(P)-dependent oxidoreductase [Gammaproteobacteria bacterium]NNF61310.1 SDR family NAD(P)-dependent oxidoreductase [Gammaproteobacteria bacterium]